MGDTKQRVSLGENKVEPDSKILITVPVAIKQQSGRKDIIVPQASGQPIRQTPLIRALANAHKWAEMLHSGEVKSVLALARKLKLSDAYVTRVLSLNSLAPDIVEAILCGKEPSGLSLATLMKGFPEDWQEQRLIFEL